MPRDYAHTHRRRSGIPGWVWMVVGLSIGGVAVFAWLEGPWTGIADATRDAGPAQEAPPPKKPERKPEPAVTLPPKEKPRFTFYELLPSEEVVVPREEQARPNTRRKAGDSRYIIQVASFRAREDAEAQRAQLALLGIESRIETVTIDEADTFYRVRVGPLEDFGKVQIISSRLEDNGLPAMVVKVK